VAVRRAPQALFDRGDGIRAQLRAFGEPLLRESRARPERAQQRPQRFWSDHSGMLLDIDRSVNIRL
jgi:hypothetical protein